MNNKELNIALGKLFNGIELDTHKVELGIVDDIENLLEKAEKQFEEAKNDLKKAKSILSRTLIIADQNIPPNLKKAQKSAKELGANDIVSKLDKIESRAKAIVKEAMPLYKSI